MDILKRGLSLLLTLVMVFSMIPANHAHGAVAHSCTIGGQNVTWKEWTSANSLPTTAGNYYLTKDVTLTSRADLIDGLVLCLNGKTLTAPEIMVGYGKTVTITDCVGTGKLTTSASTNVLSVNGTCNFYGGTITGANRSGNAGGVYVNNVFNMYGGEISGNKATRGAGVYISISELWGTTGVFNMYGGTITGNTAAGSGGGVYVNRNTTFNMYGGTLNSNVGSGSGAYVEGTFNRFGGSIGSSSVQTSGGLYNKSYYQVVFQMNGYGTQVESKRVLENNLATAPTAPTDENATFVGWYKDEALTTPWDFATDKVTTNTTLYAKWEVLVHTHTFGTDSICTGCGILGGYCGDPNVNDGKDVSWTLTDGVLTISGNGAMKDSGGKPWYSVSDQVETVVINDGVTSIGKSAFDFCRNLKSVTIPGSVTTIGARAFYDCDLTTVTIPDSVTSIGEYAFAHSGLKSVIIPESVITIGYAAFEYCGLTSVTIPKSVTSIGGCAFLDCRSMTAFVVDENNPAYCSDSRGVLYDKNKTKLIQAPAKISGDYAIPAGVTTIGAFAFYYCYDLTGIQIPNTVTTLEGQSFCGCSGLTSVTIPGSITTMSGNVFERCGLKSVTIEQGVTTIGERAFICCYDLTEVTLPAGVTTIGEAAFSSTINLSSITIPDSVTFIGDGAFYDCPALKDVYYGGTKEQWKQIDIDYDNDPLESATIHYPDPCADGHDFASGICTDCGAIEISAATFPDANFRSYITSQSYGADNVLTREEAQSVTSIDVSGKSIKNLTGIQLFTALETLRCNVNQLTSLDMSECPTLKSLECYSNQLTSLDVSDCTNLKYLNCDHNQLTELDVSGLATLEGLYCYDNQLTELDVSGLTALKTLFCDENQLTELDVSGLTALSFLTCYKNQLTSLDVSGCTALGWLECYENQLTSLDMSNLTALHSLYCHENQLTSLDVSGCAALKNLNCYSNQRTVSATRNQFDLSNLAADGFNITRASNWRGGKVDGTILTATAQKVTYTYNMGNGKTETFTLVIDGFCTHSWIAADCDTPKTCTLCGATTGNANGHTEETYEAKDPTCTETGLTAGVKCKVCGDWLTEQQVVSATGHTKEEIPAVEATCTAIGLTAGEKCSVCKVVLKSQVEVPMKEHKMQVKSTVPETCTVDGSVVRKCENCTHETTEVLTAKGHNWVDDLCTSCDAIQINTTTFPDTNFRNYITSQTYGIDNVLTEDELGNVTEINVNNCNISDLTGIQYFTALKTLYCCENQLIELDVSKNTVLTNLECYQNQLTSLDVSKNTELRYLSCYGNQLTQLDVSKNTELRRLSCSINQLTELDVRKNTELEYLSCGSNQLTELDVSKNTALETLSCHSNQLTSLDVSKNTALKELSCRGNRLSELDVSKNTALTKLECYHNQLTQLDVSKNDALDWLLCGSNKLTSLDVSKNEVLYWLSCSFNQLTSLDVSGLTALEKLACSDNQRIVSTTRNQFDLSTLAADGFDISKASNWVGGTVSGNILTATADTVTYTYNLGNGKTATFTLLIEDACADGHDFASGICTACDAIEISATTFPDANFRSYITSQSYGADNVLTQEEVQSVTSISVGSRNIKDLTGIQYFTALKTLSCDSNQLTELDVSGCTALTGLYLGANQLTSLDVSKNTALTKLFCYNNQLTELDVSGCTALETLYCYSNQLTSLDVSKNTALEYLYCEYNQLTALNVSGLTALESLECHFNQLTSLDVSKNNALNYLYCADNQRTVSVTGNKLDLSTLSADGFDVTKASNWVGGTVTGNILTATADTVTYTYNLGNGKTATFTLVIEDACADGHDFASGICTVCGAIEISATTFPDANFRSYITSRTYGADGLLTQEEVQSVTSISVDGRKIKDLTGIQHFTALKTLSCYNNQLTSLDVSGCTALKTLTCSSNQLTSLDVSGCTALETLYWAFNQLTSLDVSKNTALTHLSCSYNQLTSLDVSKNTALTYLDCSSNQLTSLDVSKNNALNYLYCSDNQLTSLNVSGCTALDYLDCHSNQLTSLDVSNLAALKTLSCYNNQLTSLDVSVCTALEYIDCSSNQLTSLDVSGCTALETLSCDNNQLTGLDVSGLTSLVYLSCDNNHLTSLDLSDLTMLEWLYCSSNQLTSLDVSGCTALQQLFCEQNQLTSLDVSKNNALKWLSCYYNQRTVFATNNQFDLSSLAADGFDISKASAWDGGTVTGNILTATADTVTYTYDLGNGETETFTLVMDGFCSHTWQDATCSAPKTCSSCGATEGAANPDAHTYENSVCTGCGAIGGQCGESAYWEMDAEGVVTIYGSGATYNFAAGKVAWFGFADQITGVVVENGVTRIGNYAFENCANIAYADLSQDGLAQIGTNAFAGCTSLRYAIFSSDLTTIGNYAFSYTKLMGVEIPAGVTSIGSGAFNRCTSLLGIEVDEDNPNYSSDSYGALLNKEQTRIIRVPGGLTGCYVLPNTVTEIPAIAFFGCETLESLVIPAGVATVGTNAFAHCNKLKTVIFCGTESQWNAIDVDFGNEKLENAARQYHAFQPATCASPESCNFCGETQGETLNHSYASGICTECGKAQQAVTITSAAGKQTEYDTLEDAAKAAVDGDTITLNQKADLKNALTFNSGNITLEMNGKNINVAKGCLYDVPMINVSGATLTIRGHAYIMDSGSGDTNYTQRDTSCNIYVYSGKLILDNVTVYKNCKEYAMVVGSNGTVEVKNCPTFNEIVNYGDLTINNSTVSGISTNEGSVTRVQSGKCSVFNAGTLYISGGTVTSIFNYTNCLTEITGGTVSGIDNSGHLVIKDDAVITGEMFMAAMGTAAISGGTFTGGATLSDRYNINKNLGELLAEGYVYFDGTCAYGPTHPLALDKYIPGDPDVTVVPAESKIVASRTEADGTVTYYVSVEEATRAGMGGVVKLLADTTLSYNTTLDYQREVLDLNGHTLTIPEEIILSISGVLALNGGQINGSYTYGALHGGIGGQCGENVWWQFRETDGTLTIFGSGDMADYAEYGNNAPWRSQYTGKIKKVVVEEGVTGIGSFSFWQCDNLEQITIASSVQRMGDGVFYGCDKLAEVTIPYGVTAIGQNAFYGCVSLYTLKIPESVTTIGVSAFVCSGLRYLVLPKSVTKIDGNAFGGCDKLWHVLYTGTEAQRNSIEVVNDSRLYSATWHYQAAGNEISAATGSNCVENHLFYCEICKSNCVEPIYSGSHTWQDATCITPKTCSSCGATQGESLGHDWVDADCDTAKTCKVCGETEGAPLNHNWLKATCTAPETCSRCGATEGESLGHDWADADCDTPKTCKVCGETEGESLGHDWADADCDTPKTCERCGATEGNALGHDWLDADCETAKTCKVCGETEGEALGHDWVDADCETAKTCKVCGETEGESLGHDWADADCDTAKTCKVCGETEGAPLNHNWLDATCTAPGTCENCGETRGQIMPDNHHYQGTVCIHCGRIGGKWGEHHSWHFDPATGKLTISGTGDLPSMAGINPPWNDYASAITSLELEEGITSVGEQDFFLLTNLQKVELPESVTYIYDHAFSSCYALKELELPEGLLYIGNYAFWSCPQYTTITIPEKVAFIGDEAFWCEGNGYITFEGPAPQFGASAFKNVTGTAVYPIDELTWTEDARQNYGGAITWIADCCLNGHAWTPADCETAKTCSRCGETEGSALNHDWTPADCETAKTCKRCGATEGTSTGHAWIDATCYNPKTCNNCGTTVGEMLKHDWVEADCEQPKHCKNCTATEGSAPGHDWADADCENPKTCKRCGETEGTYIGHSWIEASCYNPRNCSVCGKIDSVSWGHDWQAVVDGTGEICNKCGATRGDVHSHTWLSATCSAPETCTSCGVTRGEKLPHTPVVDPAVEATCTTEGKSEGSHCSVCLQPLVIQQVIPVKAHTEVIDPAVPATCTADGLTEGKHCTVCGTVTVAQQTVPRKNHTWQAATCTEAKTCSICAATQGNKLGHDWKLATCTENSTCKRCGKVSYGTMLPHTEVIDQAVAATCTTTGLTEGKHCSVCGKVTVAQQTVPTKAHTEVTDRAVAATCTTTGLTEGSHCAVCGKVIKEQDKIPVMGHTPVVDAAVEPTCTATGLTAGAHCVVCDAVLKAQQTVAKKDHTWKAATCSEPKTCTVCGETSGYLLGHDWTAGNCTTPKTCKVCGVKDGGVVHAYEHQYDYKCDLCGTTRIVDMTRPMVDMYRMYNPNTGEHFYTGSEVERDNLIAVGWQYEGVGFTFPLTTGKPVHRLFQPSTGEHLYTMDEAEKAKLMAEGWNYEGIAFNSGFENEVPQYRLWNPNATVGAYHFTASLEERDNLLAAGWIYQGIGWYSLGA